MCGFVTFSMLKHTLKTYEIWSRQELQFIDEATRDCIILDVSQLATRDCIIIDVRR
jgi:hypothetical protein